MPPASKRPTPPERMVELLAIEKRRLLAANGTVTRQDFERAWEACWWTMVLERAFPHATRHRRAWRMVLEVTRSECKAAFLDEPSPYATAAARLVSAANGMCVRLTPDQVPMALLAAHAYTETKEGEDVLAA